MEKKEIEKPKSLDIFELGKDTFNFHYNNLKNTKKSLKNYFTILDSFTTSIKEHKNTLDKIINEIPKYSPIDKPFNILKKLEILINLQYNFNNSFLQSTENIFENMKNIVNNLMNTIGDYLSFSQKLAMNIKNVSENYFSKYDKLIKSLEETELSIIEEYVKKTYKVCLKKRQNTTNDKDSCVNEALVLEGEFLNCGEDLKKKINNYIDEYNSNIKRTKPKMSQLNEEIKIDISNIIEIMKVNNNNYINALNKESENLNNIDNNDIFKKEFKEYLNYFIQKDEICEIQKLLNLNKYNLIIPKEEKKNIIEVEKEKIKNRKIKILTYTSEDIFNMVKIFYDCNFEIIDKTSYNLEKEQEKIEIVKLMRKLLNYNFDTNICGEEETIRVEEKIKLNDLVLANEEYFTKFLFCLNNYRTTGKYEVSKDIYDTVKIIFNNACDKLLIKNNKFISGGLIIISQTFYIKKDDKKYFLQKDIQRHKLFRNPEFWIDYIENLISEELSKFEDEIIKKGILYSAQRKQEKKNDILFSTIASSVANLNSFELDRKTIDNILLPIIDKYKLSEELKQSILSIVQAK